MNIKNREKTGATWVLRNNRFCKGGDLQTAPEFKKLGTLRNQGAFFIPTPPEYNGLLWTADRAV